MELEFIDRVAQLARRYLHQARPLTPTADEFVSWVDTQALTSRPALYKAGPQAVWALFSPSFHEHVLTERGHPFPAFLVEQLSPADYLRWVELYGTPTLAPDEL